MPLAELPAAATRSRAEAIVLSGSVNLDLIKIQHDIEQLVKAVNIPVFIGGRTSTIYFDDIVRIGAIPLGEDIALGIKRIVTDLEKESK